MIKQLVRTIIDRIILWCYDDASTNEIFNSIRINALIRELSNKNIIDMHSYEKSVSDAVLKVLDSRS